MHRVASLSLAAVLLGAVAALTTACDPPTSTLTIYNDTSQRVKVLWCDDTTCVHPFYPTVVAPQTSAAGSGYSFVVKITQPSGSVVGCITWAEPRGHPQSKTIAVSAAVSCGPR